MAPFQLESEMKYFYILYTDCYGMALYISQPLIVLYTSQCVAIQFVRLKHVALWERVTLFGMVNEEKKNGKILSHAMFRWFYMRHCRFRLTASVFIVSDEHRAHSERRARWRISELRAQPLSLTLSIDICSILRKRFIFISSL